MNGASETKTTKLVRGAAWRCASCGALLGVQHGDELHVQRKKERAVIIGTFRTACRRCQHHNETTTVKTTAIAAT